VVSGSVTTVNEESTQFSSDSSLLGLDGIGFSSGGGNVEKQITDGVLRKIYKLELYINK
jgi:hypothetical protein